MHDKMDEKAIDGWFQFDYVLDLAKGIEIQNNVNGWIAESLHQNRLQGLAEKNQWKAIEKRMYPANLWKHWQIW